ncbi:NEAT domain-containing protein [Clostridium sporogenes]|uniref:NEAT domain-containing protein n=1 Tax=Clostridium sporogenes TaxID=1509 RepID=UPI00223794C5|nr:NEAT domain-containing protein [Clostridium sporogenes]MCW6093604.1 NEAT domain-containing protein [Clostridium sporogenes]
MKTYIDEMNKDVNFGVKLKEDTLKLSDTKPEQKPETKPDTEKPENKSDTKPDEGKSETKAEQKPETKPISKEEKDGLYSLKAKILKENSDDPSMSAQYVKDINYEVKDAKKYLIVTLNRTDWMKNITATVDGKEITPTVIEKIKNNNGEEISRIKFPINSLDSKIKLTMNVVPMDNSRVSFRIVPDKNSLKSIKEYNNIASEKDESNSENFKKEDKLVKINSLADGGKEEGKATGKVLPKTGSPINSGLLGSLGVIISGLGLGLKKKGKK